MERVICYIVKPKKNLQEVRNCLDASGISYSYDTDIIFANLAKSFPALDEVADVKDPVFEENGKWYFVCEGDVSNPFENEDRARVNFVQYISWSGEFVNNAHPRNDA